MNRSQKIFLILFTFILISTFNPQNSNKNFFQFFNFFNIKNIEVKNNFLVETYEIKKKLNYIYSKNIFSLNKKELAKSINQIDLINSVEIKRKFPNSLLLFVNEEKIAAILYKKEKKYFITKSNNLINYDKNLVTENLPLVFGTNAALEFNSFVELLKKNAFSIESIKGYYFFNINRWDLHLKNGKIIKLPPTNVDQAINRANSFLLDDKFKKYSILDLRIDDKLIAQ